MICNLLGTIGNALTEMGIYGIPVIGAIIEEIFGMLWNLFNC